MITGVKMDRIGWNSLYQTCNDNNKKTRKRRLSRQCLLNIKASYMNARILN